MLDNFWIFIIIIGAVISITQKSQRKQHSADSDGTPSLDPQAELERRMREIFGESKRVEPVAENKPTPTPNKPAYTQLKTTSAQTQAKSANRHTNSTMRKAASELANTAKKQDPIKRGEITSKKSDIDEIIEDFTMEKALIYSEVIRPKFEEL